MWTQFWDMHSGGSLKEAPYDKIYIEAPEDEATAVFYSRLGHNPNDTACSCCGPNYSISESESLEQATGYHRGCKYDQDSQKYLEESDPKTTFRDYMTIREYVKQDNVLIIKAVDIKASEKTSHVPEADYPDYDDYDDED